VNGLEVACDKGKRDVAESGTAEVDVSETEDEETDEALHWLPLTAY